ncbi:MAG TPA: UDP-glucose 4-epimerase, partial [Microbacterium sp.]|nr:UDP-glucose 4-epimerase [Microbacterium sp.]
MRIALTGATGKLGSVAIRELRAAGHDVTGFDVVGARASGFVQVDLTDYGQVIDALGGVDRTAPFDAVVHLAAIPAPGLRTDVATFHNNMPATFNVFWAAARLGIRRIVYASSETVLGLPF